jgi:acyl-coenzyme A synthetase/AMP-(fatty) acid ligase
MGEEDIKLFVVKKHGTEVTEEKLIQHCGGCMARFMVPKQVVFLEEMPRTSSGKPEKGKLAALNEL